MLLMKKYEEKVLIDYRINIHLRNYLGKLYICKEITAYLFVFFLNK